MELQGVATVAFALLFPSSIGAAFLAFGLERWRPIQGFRFKSAADLSRPGPGRIAGSAKLRDVLLDPIYKRQCVFYDILVYSPGQTGGMLWREQSAGHPFVVEDKTGKSTVLADDVTWVDMPYVEGRYNRFATTFGRWFSSADPEMMRYLEKAAIDRKETLPAVVMLTATIVRPHQQICVGGWADWTGSGLALRNGRRQPLVIASSPSCLTRRRFAGSIFTLLRLALAGFGMVLFAAAWPA